MNIGFTASGKICSFQLTADLLDFLWQNNLYFGNQHQPRKLQGRRFSFDADVGFGRFSAILNGGEIVNMGSYSYSHSPLSRGMSIGNYCSLAIDVRTMGVDHPFERFSSSGFTYDGRFPIYADSFPELENRFQHSFNVRGGAQKAKIGHDVWIGGQVLLANNIQIGNGAIVAAGSVVTKDVPPYTIVGGNPAKPIKKRFASDIEDRLTASQWYQYPFPYFRDVDVSQSIELMTEQIENALASKTIPQIGEAKKLIYYLEDYLGRKLLVDE